MKFKIFVLVLLPLFFLKAQDQMSSSEILHELNKLQNSSTVLYLAAHPDDENTRMISWLTNGVGAKTAYLSLTRGDGGQNLIGTELGAKLGVLRTQELMQARKIDGGNQFFTRAVDFGYSKTSDETLEKWADDIILKDVVWMLRKFRPDVIITRFPPDKRGGHGHHTASAILGIKAFNMAADKEAFPEQLAFTDTWQAKRIYWNTSKWWGNENLDSLVENSDEYISLEVGGYNSLQGTSYNELASLSRTQHKSQGFGVSVARGEQVEYLQYLDGEKAKNGLFDGISSKWERFGFAKGDKELKRIIENFDPLHPEESVEDLLKLRELSVSINQESQREYFASKLNSIIAQCLGLHIEALADSEFLSDGAPAEAKLEFLLRKNLKAEVKVKNVQIAKLDKKLDISLVANKSNTEKLSFICSNANSQPYWLRARYVNIYEIREVDNIGKPENDPALSAKIRLSIMGHDLEINVPLNYKFSDRVEGEIIRPVVIVPAVVVSSDQENIIFTNTQEQRLNLTFRFFEDKEVHLNLEAEGWDISPSFLKIKGEKDQLVQQSISIKATEESYKTNLKISVDSKPARSLSEIDYSHIEKRIVFEELSPKLVKIRLKKEGNLVGYIPGAGDKVSEAIELMGYHVEILDQEKIKNTDLSKYQAIVAGIRAYNTEKWLPSVKDELMAYVKNGGNYIVQYNTRSRDLLSLDIGPYPFKLSRERVTEELAKANFLIEDHPTLNYPNKIDLRDFAGWVQERGLYFAGTWADEYDAPIGWADKGEPMRKGGLIVGNYGKGAFIYTGISFFRELPAGVPGAYRLLANLISYSSQSIDE